MTKHTLWLFMVAVILEVATSNPAAQGAPSSPQNPTLEIAVSLSFTEGPAVDPQGNIYFSDVLNDRIMRLGADGMLTTYREHSNVPNGLVIDPQGRLIACEGSSFNRPWQTLKGQPRITRTDLKTGAIEVLADNFEGQPFTSPNDVTLDGKGRIYFTDLNGHGVYRIDGPRNIVRILAPPNIERPNGIQISPDDRTLYVIDSTAAPGSPRLIRAFDLRPDGAIGGNMRVHFTYAPGLTGDGMSIDTQGNLYGTAGFNGVRGRGDPLEAKSGVYVIAPAGTLLKFIPIPEDLVTNDTFGGPDMKTLYVTAGKTLFKFSTEIPGLRR